MTADRLAALEAENAKLRKINQVLMNRVERSMDFQGNAFSLFQTAIVLESRVRERTMALESALRELEATNQALNLAKEEQEQAKQFLSEAIESINEGFVLCDADDRLVLYNSKYREMWPGLPGGVPEGLPFAEMVRRAVASGLVQDAAADAEDWVSRRLSSHYNPGEPFVIQFRNGVWLQVSERRTRNGGIVGLYTDITEIKVSEKRRRERELAEKSILLQATLDNLSQGVSVFDASLHLAAWNQRFAELLGAPDDLVHQGTTLEKFLTLDAVRAQFSVVNGTLEAVDTSRPMVLEHETPDSRVLEIRRNQMPDGGFVTTYTDITARKRSEEALRDSERRIRLVTDAMPAQIAYVDASETYRFTNKAYENWFGRPRSEINGRPMRDVLGDELYSGRAEFVHAALAGQECTFEMTIPSRLGRPQHYALANYVPHFAPDGQVLGFFALIQDITERRLNAEALQEAKESLERRVEERTAELRNANLELSDAKAEAETANLSKTRFLAAASHDLLQPLAAARVFTSALADRRMAPRNRQLVGSSLSALDSVDELLTALLDISKLDAGVLPVETHDFRASDILSALHDEYQMLARAKGLDLRFVPCTVAIRSDPRLLGRILRNFISNAIRYTPQGRILVGCQRRGDHLLIGVRDTGIGIPPDKMDEIFEEFRRLSRSGDGAERGMGLGLAIVKRISRMLGHRLVVQSRPGTGSLFGIEIPLSTVTSPAALRTAAPTLPAGGQAAMAGKLVLMIDNEPDILRGMAALLEGWGLTTLGARSLEDARRLLADSPRHPDLLIADYHLDDGACGLDALRDLERDYSGIPAMVITANHSPALIAEIRTAGYHLLNKPIKPGRLRSLMAHLLRKDATPMDAERQP